ncbi:unnamed protein product [Ranitomeya imitator]|uniref:Uncharacterized protein n=1 Tax=Ranitomeya imitator TaxID=111125 RepID=A0ABN9MLQ5_9NEOB|nr:unnamed protein product [Ranitomeya imitator]
MGQDDVPQPQPAASSKIFMRKVTDHRDSSREGGKPQGHVHTFNICMIVIIILLVAAIALIIGLSVAGNSSANDVTTINAVGQISGNVLLSCTFAPDVKQSSDVLWEKVGDTGVVYKYENGKISLSDQNSKYKSRTSLFLNELSVGNATLMISSLRSIFAASTREEGLDLRRTAEIVAPRQQVLQNLLQLNTSLERQSMTGVCFLIQGRPTDDGSRQTSPRRSMTGTIHEESCVRKFKFMYDLDQTLLAERNRVNSTYRNGSR